MAFKVHPAELAPVMVLEPDVIRDARGFFFESYNRQEFKELGIENEFVQDNHSYSTRHVLRGIHYQVNRPQGKLVRVGRGEVFDVAVDLRQGSATLGKWVAERLSSKNHRMLWVPPGFGHAFLVLSDDAHVMYKVTAAYSQPDDRCIRWNDPELGIQWPLAPGVQPILSPKDTAAPMLRNAELL